MKRSPLKYKTFDSFAIVGTNTTKRSNGIVDPNYHGVLLIPKTYNGLPITEIGTYALSDCSFVTHVIIEANIISIHSSAFERTTNLTSINIPSSVEYIGGIAFSSFNAFNASIPQPNFNSLGTLIVSFESNSNLQKIGGTPFGRKEHIILKFKNKLPNSFTCSSGWHYSAGTFTILSEEEFTACRETATVVPFVDVMHDVVSAKKILMTMKECTYKRIFIPYTSYRRFLLITLLSN